MIETGLPSVYIWPQLVAAINAGLAPASAAWSPAGIVTAGVAVRTGFHLYCSWGALPLALWAGLSVWAFLRWHPRRVAPFVIAHIVFDAWLIMVHFGFTDMATLLSLVFLLAGLLAWLAHPGRFLVWRQARRRPVDPTTRGG